MVTRAGWRAAGLAGLILATVAAAQEGGATKAAKVPTIVNEVEGQTAILKLVPEGTVVRAGDVVCELDSGGLSDDLLNQQGAVRRAQAELESAKMALDAATIAVDEYTEGTFRVDEARINGEIDIAAAEETLLKEQRDVTQKLTPQDRMVLGRLDVDVMKAKNIRDDARRRLDVLTRYTRPRRIRELTVAVNEASFNIQFRELAYAQAQFKEEKLRRQIDKCVIRAPVAGKVEYLHWKNAAGQPMTIEEGAPVRERQILMKIQPQ